MDEYSIITLNIFPSDIISLYLLSRIINIVRYNSVYYVRNHKILLIYLFNIYTQFYIYL